MKQPTILGAAITTVRDAVAQFEIIFSDFPRLAEVRDARPDEHYPVDLYVEMTNYMEAQFGYGSMLRLGKQLGQAIVDISLSQLPITTVRDAVAAIQGAHEHWCTPPVGAFEIVAESADRLTLKYTAPYNCVLQEGLFQAVTTHYGTTLPLVTHKTCRRDGGDHCLFKIAI